MLIILLNRILHLILFLSILNTVRRTYFLVKALMSEESGYFLDKRELLTLGLSIGYILTCIFTGINF